MNVSPPIVIEDRTSKRTAWLLSFGGNNPEPSDCIELTEDQCWWIRDKIMKIDPNLFERAKQLETT